MLERLLILIAIVILIVMFYLKNGGQLPKIDKKSSDNPFVIPVKKSDQFIVSKYETPLYTPDYLRNQVGLPNGIRQITSLKEQLKRNILAEIRGSQAFNNINTEMRAVNAAASQIPAEMDEYIDPQMRAVNAAASHIPGEMEEYIEQLGQQTTNQSINLPPNLKSEMTKLFGNNINSSLSQTAATKTTTN